MTHDLRAYWRGCRCPTCRAANAAYQRGREAVRPPRPHQPRPPRPSRIPPEPDEVAVERAANGDRRVPLTRQEMAAAEALLNAHGYSAAAIADRLGVTERTVVRWRTGRTTLPHGRPRTPGEQAC